MKGLLVFLFFCLALASATVAKRERQTFVADEKFLQRHDDLYRLFYHVHQPNPYQTQVELGRAYNFQSNPERYTNNAVQQFTKFYNNGVLPKGRPFSIMYKRVLDEATALFDLFFFAKDYDTFYQTACWAREFINEEMFVYALTAAVVHRPDCQGFILPPLYEILPYYFFPAEVIELAYKVKMQGHARDVSPDVFYGKDNVVYINSNYSGWYVNNNWEQRINYFTEDISWNAFYYRMHLELPFWMDSVKYNVNQKVRGDFVYIAWHQLLVRYYFERLSNGMGEIPQFSWDAPIEEGYNPQLRYVNGVPFPERPNFYQVNRFEEVNKVQDYERRIRDALDRGYVVSKNGTRFDLRDPDNIHVVSSLVESNYDSVDMDYYGYPQYIARSLIGNSPRPYNDGHFVVPSALKFYQTTLRDPAYYQFGKYYYNMFYRKFKSYLTPYTQEELAFPGVKVENVEVSNIVTFFEDVDTDITNIVQYTAEDVKQDTDSLVIMARQSRLNHKPYTVTVNLSSEKATKVTFRFFIGPKYNAMGEVPSLRENRENFLILDQFVYDLKSGKNVVERSSLDFWFFDDDFSSYRNVREQMRDALKNKKEFRYGDEADFDSIPRHLVMPRGKRGGMPFQLFVFVTPYVPAEHVDERHPMIDVHNYGYPFDRPVVEANFQLSNLHFEDIVIYHKTATELNKVV